MTPGAFTPRSSLLASLLLSLRLPVVAVSLATQMHSLARYSKRTTQTRRSVPFDVYEVSGSFNTLSRVLFNVPSRYLYAIGLETYLRLEVDDSQFPAPFPGSSTLDTFTACSFFATGVSPCFPARSSALHVCERGLKEGPKPHIPDDFHRLIRFAVCGVQSLLLPASQLISFPPGTKTFQFPGFPNLSVFRRKSDSEILGSIPAYGSPRLFAVSHVLHRRLKPSPPPHRVVF